MGVELEAAALHMVVAVILGALIGTERQARQRMAGIRTNALVALAAAGFVTFSALFAQDASPTRVAAQIVSGIGFLGAGLIFRDGVNVHGINTAATLWCSAAVGMMAGVGALPLAGVLTAIVLVLNLFLRPVVNWLDVTILSGRGRRRRFRVSLTCLRAREAEVRMLMVKTLLAGGLRLADVDTRTATDDRNVEVVANLIGEGVADEVLQQAVALLAVEQGVSHAEWHEMEEG